jgi:hypothetical protein
VTRDCFDSCLKKDCPQYKQDVFAQCKFYETIKKTRKKQKGVTMTTTIKIEAHLATTKEVKVSTTDDGVLIDEFFLQDGETAARSVYDGREISVREVEK